MDAYSQFLDESKAFDGVNTLYIFTKLLRRDAPGYSVVLLLLGTCIIRCIFVRVVRGIGEAKSHF